MLVEAATNSIFNGTTAIIKIDQPLIKKTPDDVSFDKNRTYFI